MVVKHLRRRLESSTPTSDRREFSDFSDLRIVDDDDDDDEGIDDVVVEGSAGSSGWSTLPHILLEDILAFVPQKDRFAAALVCRRWAQTFSAPRVWRKIEVSANSFMCKKMRFRRTSHGNGQYQKTYVTEQKVDSPKLFQDCINFIGRFVKCVEFLPISDFRKVVEFLSALKAFEEEDAPDEGFEERRSHDRGFEDPRRSPRRIRDEGFEDRRRGARRYADEDIDEELTEKKSGMPLAQLEEFIFNYAFDTMETSFEGTQVLGTGGTILAQLKDSVRAMKHLKRLELHNLFLDADDGLGILNSFVGCNRLKEINAFNLTKEPVTTIDPRLFPNLEVLLLSPLQLTEELVSIIPESASLQRLDVAFDEFSDCSIQVIDKKLWAEIKEKKPMLQLRLECRGLFDGDFLIVAHAPVTHVIYRNPTSTLTIDTIKSITECYKSTLTCYAHLHLPCTHLTKKTADRVHSALLELARVCPRLTTIAVREMIFSSTILYLLKANPNIRNLYVRRGALLMKNIFSPNQDRQLSLDEHRFFRLHSSSVKNLRQGVDHLLRDAHSIGNVDHLPQNLSGIKDLYRGVDHPLRNPSRMEGSSPKSSAIDDKFQNTFGWRPLSDNSFKRCLD